MNNINININTESPSGIYKNDQISNIVDLVLKFPQAVQCISNSNQIATVNYYYYYCQHLPQA